MTGSDSLKEKVDLVQACVIIPTYNNAATLATVIEDVQNYSDHIIVVNDGSTDNSLELLTAFPSVQLISYPKNVGKGWALRKAFAYAAEKGYRYGITIDSDGQHFAKDLPQFIDKIDPQQDAIIIGARNMDQASVPGGSSFGNRFSNFWFWAETGIKSPDTQSGYRLYPVQALRKMRFFTRKYEFEIEVLVRAAWKGIKIESVPVTVYYAPKETRVSHFRPYKDFLRISLLNTVLVLISFLYIKPRDFISTLFNRQKFRKLLNDHLYHPHHSAQLKATSVAFGVFMGIIPIWGFQLVSAIFLAILLKLNKPLVIVAANISIPPMIPVIIFLSYKMGALWMGAAATDFDFSKSITISSIKQNLLQYIYGSITLAIVAAMVFWLLTFVLLKLFGKKQAVVS
jgi:glycosyltransferase involved in cell wall biosynthesis